MTTITLQLDGAEAMVLTAALAHYEALLASCLQAGGDATDAALNVGPIAERISRRLQAALYDPEPTGDHHVYPMGVGR